jgi:zinc transport system substrate-binding protein
MKKIIRIMAVSLVLLCSVFIFAEARNPEGKMRVGITLHPYYSFAANIVEDAAEVIPLIGAGFNPHAYTPRPEDIKRVMTLDCLIVNGIGHDEFAFEIIKAARVEDTLPIIYANDGVSLIPVSGYDSVERIVNPHTFISITASIQQIYNISKELQKLDPDNAPVYRENTRKYVTRLRRIKAEYMKRIAGTGNLGFTCATIHGGYDYLLQEFGVHVSAVVEPSHGAHPTASQLKETIDTIKSLNVDVLFTELDFPDKYVDTIEEETGVALSHLSHLTVGGYSADKFEIGMRENMESLTDALISTARKIR